MPSGSDKNNPAATTGPILTAGLAMAAILLLMGFSFLCFRAGNPTLAGTAGMAAIGLIGWAVRRLLKSAFPGQRDDDGDPPSTQDAPSTLEVL